MEASAGLHSCIACGDEAPLLLATCGGVLCASCAREVEGAEALVLHNGRELASYLADV